MATEIARAALATVAADTTGTATAALEDSTFRPTLPGGTPAPPMSIKLLSFTTDLNATQVITPGFRAKCGWFLGVGTTPAQDGVIQNDQHISYGFFSGTGLSAQRYALIRSSHGVSPSVCKKELGNGVMGLFSPGAAALDQALQVQSIGDTTITLTKPVNALAGWRVYALICGGTEFQNVKATDISIDDTLLQPYPGFNFTPTLLQFLGVRGQDTATLPGILNIADHATFSVGAILSALQQWAIGTSAQNNLNTAGGLGAVSHQRTDRGVTLLSTSNAPVEEKRAAFSSFDADGFTLDLVESGGASSARRESVLAMRGPRFYVGTLNRLTNPSIVLPFKALGLLFASRHKPVGTGVDGDCEICLGLSDGNSHGAVWTRLSDNAMPTVAKRAAKDGKCFISADASPAIDTQTVPIVANTVLSLSSAPSGAVDDEILFLAIGRAEPGSVPPDTSYVFEDMTVPMNVPETPKPAYRVPVVEPTFRDADFDTPTITRIAGEPGTQFTVKQLPLSNLAPVVGTWGGRVMHVYSKQQPWSYDGDLFFMENRKSDDHLNVHLSVVSKLILDGHTMEPLYSRGPVAEANLWEYRWHPSHQYNSVMVNVTQDGKKLQWIDLLTDSIIREWNLALRVPQGVHGFGSAEGNLSDDGRYIALFKEVDPAGITSNDCLVFVVDMNDASVNGMGPVLTLPSSDPIGIFTNKVPTWATMSSSGGLVVIHWRGEKTSVLNFSPTTLELTPIDYTNGFGFGSGRGGDVWCSKDYACATDGTTIVKSPGDVRIFASNTGFTGQMVRGGKVGGVPTDVYVKRVLSPTTIPAAPDDYVWIEVSQALDANPAITLRIGDRADLGYIWRMGHADVASNPYDGGADVIVGQDQRVPYGDAWNGRPISHVVMVKLLTGEPTSLTAVSIGGVPEAVSSHISTRNKRKPGWAYVGYFEKTGASDQLYQQEIVAVKLVAPGAPPSTTGMRFAHHHSDQSTLNGNPDNTYQAEPHACPSWSGDQIVFKSDWTRECDGGCGDGHYENVAGDVYPAGVGPYYPAGIYQAYVITAIFDLAPSVDEDTTATQAATEEFSSHLP